MKLFALLVAIALSAAAHDGHGKQHAPASAKALKSPLTAAQSKPELAKPLYEKSCASCHGSDGMAKTSAAEAMKPHPADLTEHKMDSMKDGEIYWVITNGIAKVMPALKTQLTDIERWQLTAYVRYLRSLHKTPAHKH